MVRYVVLALILIAVAPSLSAQEEPDLFRAVKADTSIESFRPLGDARTWIFYAQQQTFGRLISTVSGTREINGRRALTFDESLEIDYTMIGGERKSEIKGEFYIAPEGSYLGCRLTLGPDSVSERFEVDLNNGRLEGFYTRAGSQVEVNVPLERDYVPWEASFVDQLEIFLAMRDLKVGDTIVDSVFSPQIMMPTRIVGRVTRWMWQEIYKDKIDSVFIIRLTEPGDFQLYFTADKRLVRVDMENQNIRVYQGQIRGTLPGGPSATATTVPARDARSTFRLMFLRSPHYAAFLAMALLSVLFLTRAGFKRFDSWLAFVAGGIGFIIIPYTQIPLQIYLVTSWLIPNVNEGGSLYFWSIFPALAAGVIQTLYAFLLLTAVLFWRKVKPFHQPSIGAFLGAGFGLIEACYVSGLQVTSLFTPILVERGFIILLHVVAGTLIGSAIGRGTERLSITIILIMLLNSCYRYLPIFIQQGKMSVPLLTIIMGFIGLAFLVYALVTLRADAKEA
ncbi:MAG: hypothetical protein GY867_06980 [bacterium]|nr:hypothetical protein [bacterium]